MSLEIGSQIAHYTVDALIGEGGMGQVYQATDTKLNRQVALKILPEAFAADPNRLARFQREAQVLASLNHPNIAQIHGIEEGDGTRALVLELVEGPTLADRIAKGPIRVDEALPIANQIAEALEAAHEAGVIHRDLKPANIKVREDGTVKVLDFGLAKALETTPEGDPSQSPTLTAAATQMGVIMGTAAYMSPEQARGKPVDTRADIWAFGCVLYEMLTGKRPFEGEDVTQTIARVVEAEPDFGRVPPDVPVAIQRVLRRSLTKDRRERLAHMTDARIEVSETLARVEPEWVPRVPVARRNRVAWGLVGLLAIAVVVQAMIALSRVAPQLPYAYRASILLPEGLTVAPGNPGARFAVSPDGTRLAFVATDADGRRQLWVRRLDSLVAQPLEGTDDALYPFWSPDGLSLGFHVLGASGDIRLLKRIDASGGPVLTLCETAGATGGTWNLENMILFTSAGVTPVYQIPASGGTPVAVTTVDTQAGQRTHREPFFLPDGAHFLYGVQDSDEGPGAVYVGSLDPNDEPRLLLRDRSSAQYANGYLLFLRGGVLVAQPFDVDSLTLTGNEVPIAEGVATLGVNGAFSVSPSGVLAYQTGTGVGADQLVWVDRDGSRSGVLGEQGVYRDLNLSPYGRRAAVSSTREIADGTGEILLLDADRGIPTALTVDQFNDRAPVWFPDGGRVIFSSARAGQQHLFQIDTSGVGSAESVLADGLYKTPLSISADGRFLLYAAATDPARNAEADLWLLALDTETMPSPFMPTATPIYLLRGEFSPDGRWVAYVSAESGRPEVYVAPYPEPTSKTRVSIAGGQTPRWHPSGAELFYADPSTGMLMVVQVRRQAGTFELGDVSAAFEFPRGTDFRTYAVNDEGRFLIIEGDADLSVPITLIVNWPASIES